MQSQQNTASHWVAPVAGSLKINVDAFVYEGISSFTIDDST